MLDNVGLRYPHRASGAKAPRTLRPLPLLRFAVSATGGAHLCSIQYYLRFWLSSCRTSLAVSALRIMRYCPEFIIQAIAIKIQSIPVFWCRIFAEHAWQQSLKTGNFFCSFLFSAVFCLQRNFFGQKNFLHRLGGQPMQEVYRFGHRLFIGSNVCFYNFTAIKGGIYRRKCSAQISQFFNHRMSFCLTPCAAFYPGGSYR